MAPSGGARLFAWTGALLFLGSLTFFLYAYIITFGETREAELLGPLTANVALFTLFALHHSVFARERVRAWMARMVPPYLERAAYVWIASLLFIAVCAWWQPVPGLLWRFGGVWRWLAYGAQAFGMWITLRSAAVIDVFELAGVRQLAKDEPREIAFKTTGPYGWVRHPIYTGWFLFVFATPAMTMTRLVFAVTSCAYLLMAIPLEERSLRRAAGEAYARYSREVRWKLVPRVY